MNTQMLVRAISQLWHNYRVLIDSLDDEDIKDSENMQDALISLEEQLSYVLKEIKSNIKSLESFDEGFDTLEEVDDFEASVLRDLDKL